VLNFTDQSGEDETESQEEDAAEEAICWMIAIK
jgi:hypothetical protein